MNEVVGLQALLWRGLIRRQVKRISVNHLLHLNPLFSLNVLIILVIDDVLRRCGLESLLRSTERPATLVVDLLPSVLLDIALDSLMRRHALFLARLGELRLRGMGPVSLLSFMLLDSCEVYHCLVIHH